jgi:flagellar biogenesis protein FliO
MNPIHLKPLTAALASCVCAVIAGTSAAQDAPLIKPLRLVELASSQVAEDEAISPTITESPSPQVVADSDLNVGATAAIAPAASAETEAATTASPETATDVAASRWSALPLPGGEKEIAAATEGGQMDGEGARDILQVGGGLAGVLLLIWLLRALVRKSSRTGAGRGLLARVRAPAGVASILARYPVARGEHVVLLEVGRRILVVHQASGSMTTLSELSDRDEVADIRARINGEEREKVEETFAPALEASLQVDTDATSLEPVEGMPGFVAETVDLTRRKRTRLAGGAV